MNQKPLSVKVSLLFLLIHGLVWLAFGVITAAGVHSGLPEAPLYRWAMAFLAFIAAGLLTGLFIFLGRRNRLAYFLTLGAFAVFFLLTIGDDIGWADLVYLVLVAVPVILLVKDRGWYLAPQP